MSEVSDDAKKARRGEGVRAGVSRQRTPVGVEGERRVGEREMEKWILLNIYLLWKTVVLTM